MVLEDGAALLLPSILGLEPDDRLLVVSAREGDATAGALSARVGLTSEAVTMLTSTPGSGRRTRTTFAPDGGETVVRGRAEALPFPEAQFTVMVAGHVARSWDDETLLAFLREAWRVLRHNGVLVLWDVAPSQSRRVNAIWQRVLRSDGGPVRLRNFAAIGRLGHAAGFAWIQTLPLRPFLWPPGPRISVLLRKEHYTKETIGEAEAVPSKRELVGVG
jgi:SAM-dependent methyltransferase